jgi:putative FmdB family regulatory protein
MPTYEYECQKCGNRFELFQRITEPPKKRCPKCKGKLARLLGTGAGLIFKGSGFYSTDYRSEGYKKAAQRESSASAPPKSEPKAAGEKKSAAKKSESAGK